MLYVQFKQLAGYVFIVAGHGVSGLVDAIKKCKPGTDLKSVPYFRPLS
jgi:hypothetical protein